MTPQIEALIELAARSLPHYETDRNQFHALNPLVRAGYVVQKGDRYFNTDKGIDLCIALGILEGE